MKVKNTSFSTKRTLNLVMDEKERTSPARIIIIAAVAVVCFAVVGKFGVSDRYQAVADAQSALNSAQDEYLSLLTQDADYADVLAEYNRYSFGGMTDEEKAVADRDQVLTLIEKTLIPAANIENAELMGNQLSVQMSGITLQQASAVVQTLNENDLVKSVAVYSANTGDSLAAASSSSESAVSVKAATVTMTITLADNPEAAAASQGSSQSTESSSASEGGN